MAAIFSLLSKALHTAPHHSPSVPTKKNTLDGTVVDVDPTVLHWDQVLNLKPCTSKIFFPPEIPQVPLKIATMAKVECALRAGGADGALYKVAVDGCCDDELHSKYRHFQSSIGKIIFRCLKVFKGQGKTQLLLAANEARISMMLSAKIPSSSVPIVRVLQAHIIDIDMGMGNSSVVGLTMEPVCEGGTLRDFMRDIRRVQGRLVSEEEALSFFVPLAKALQFCHSQGVLHRDVKPENVLLEREGRPETAHLTGFARATCINITDGDNHMSWEAIAATEVVNPYMAPECVFGGGGSYNSSSSPASDIYSLGALLLESLTGVTFVWMHLFEYDEQWRKLGPSFIDTLVLPRDCYRAWGSLSYPAKHLIRGMLCPDPVRRFHLNAILSHPWLTLQEQGASRSASALYTYLATPFQLPSVHISPCG